MFSACTSGSEKVRWRFSGQWEAARRSRGEGHPSWSSVKNPSSNAVDTGSMPSRGTEIPYAWEQRSPRDVTKT